MKEIKKIIYAVFLLSVLWVYVDSQYLFFWTNKFWLISTGMLKELEIRFDSKSRKSKCRNILVEIGWYKISILLDRSLDSDLFVWNPLWFSDPVYGQTSWF